MCTSLSAFYFGSTTTTANQPAFIQEFSTPFLCIHFTGPSGPSGPPVPTFLVCVIYISFQRKQLRELFVLLCKKTHLELPLHSKMCSTAPASAKNAQTNVTHTRYLLHSLSLALDTKHVGQGSHIELDWRSLKHGYQVDKE